MIEAISVAEPAHVLTLEPNPLLPFVPIVRRLSKTAYIAEIGGQQTFNRLMRDRSIEAVDHLRYDRHAQEMLVSGRDEAGSAFMSVHPCVPLGLVWTAGGSNHLELAMRRLFVRREDAEEATADVIRLLERIGRQTGTLIDNQ